MKSYIGAIKIYDGNGNLKDEISAEDATIRYQKYYELSDNERKKFDRLNSDDYIETYQPWIYGKSRVMREAKHEIVCVVCFKKVKMRSEKAIFCSSKCGYKKSNDRARSGKK